MSDDDLSLSTLHFEHGVDPRGRRVFLQGEIDEAAVALATRGLYFLANRSEEPVELVVDSEGGDLDGGLALHDVVRHNGVVSVSTTVVGRCMSAAVPVVAAGFPGVRIAYPSALFLLHDARVSSSSQSPADARRWADVAARQMQLYARLLGRYTRRHSSFWRSLLTSGADHVFDAREAKALGLVDRVIR